MHFPSFDPLLQSESSGQGQPILNSSGSRRKPREVGTLEGGVHFDSMGWNTSITGPVVRSGMGSMNGHYGNNEALTSIGTVPLQQMPSGEVASFDSSHQSQPLQENHGNFRLEAHQYEHHPQSYVFPQHQQPNQQILMLPPFLGGASNANELPSVTHMPPVPAPHNVFVYEPNSASFHSNSSQRPRMVPQQQYVTFFQHQQQQFHHHHHQPQPPQQQQAYIGGGGGGGLLFSPDTSPYRMPSNKPHPSSSQSNMMQVQPHHYKQSAYPRKHPAFYTQVPNGFRQYDPIPMRPSIDRPLLRLSVALIDVYKNINKSYYEERAAEMRMKKEMQQASVAAQKQQIPQRPHSPPKRRGITQKDHQPASSQWDNEESDYIIREGELFYDRYVIQERIGKGSFGQVIRAHDTVTTRDVAIKIIKSKAPFRIQAQTEIELLLSLREMDSDDQNNIVRLESHFMYRNHQCLVFELLSLNLYDLLKNTQFSGVSLNLIRKFAKQILKALQFLASPELNIIHCDLKPENILLRHPKRSGIKVVDFGSSCRSNRQTYSYIQSRFYRSPEVILGLPYTVAIDMWSLGCILVEMHTGEPLFSGSDQFDQMCKIVEVLGMVPPHMIDRSTPKYRDLFFGRKLDQFGRMRWVMRPPPPDAPKSEICPSPDPLATLSAKVRAGTNKRRPYDPCAQLDMSRTYELFEDLVFRMLAFDPQERIKPAEAMKHPFFQTEAVQNGCDVGRSSVGDSVAVKVNI